MAQIRIYGKHLAKGEIDALKKLVDDAGCGEGRVVVVDAVEPPPQKANDPVVLLLGTPATCADLKLEANLMRAHGTGQRVIWVWPQGLEPTDLPPAAVKYCYSYVPWDARKLAAVAADDDVTFFETANGEKVPVNDMERNLCVDEEEASGKKKAKGK